jgi:DNA-binding GntR family transcriptional regulator
METKVASRTDAAPLYARIARALRDEIVGGRFPVGAQLPREEDLCGRFGVSRHTVRAALRCLRDDGLIESRRRAGTVVVPPRPSEFHIAHGASIEDFLASVSRAGRLVVECVKLTALDPRTAARVGLAAGETWLVMTGEGRAEGEDAPFCLATYAIHRDFAAIGRVLARHTGPVFPLIEDMFGQRVTEVEQEITGGPMPAAVAARLKLGPEAPAIEVRRTYRTAAGLVAQVTLETHPAQHFRHTMILQRSKT